MLEKSKPFQLINRKIDQQRCNIQNDDHVIGLILIWRPLNMNLIGDKFAHRAVLLVTGNYKIDILKSPQQQKEEFENFQKKSCEQKGLRYFVLDYLDNSTSKILEIQFQGDIYLGQNNEFPDNPMKWQQEGNVIDIYSYISTIQQAYHLFESNAGQYSTIKNNCNHMAKGFITNFQNYEQKMRNLNEFNIQIAIDQIQKSQDGTLRESYKKDCGNLVFLALEFKKYGFWNNPILKVWIILKDFKPFPLNYGQIEYLERQYDQSRIQKIYEQNDQKKIIEQWKNIKTCQMEQKFMNKKHLLEQQTLPYLNAIEY